MKTIYETERLVIRQWQEKDYKDLFEYASCDSVTKFLSWQTYTSEQTAIERINHLLECYIEGKIDNDGNGKMLEWDAQSDAFSKFVVGKTAAEVNALQTQEKGGHLIAVDQALLDAGCSMQITGIKTVVAQSATNAR